MMIIALYLLSATVLILIILLAFVASLIVLAASIKGAPFAPSRPEAVKAMLSLANIKPGEKAVDLGSGDGRIVIALARAGAEAHGYEINPFLVWWARRKIKSAGLENKAFIHWKSFWPANFNQFNVVTVFGIGKIMADLEKKLKSELRPGSRVVSNSFVFPQWPVSASEKGVHCYRIN